MLTNGKNVPGDHGLCKHDGLFTRWADLCGIYFRFPYDEFEEYYGDDDYEKGSIKNWLAKKYTGPYTYRCQVEDYSMSLKVVTDMMRRNPLVEKKLSFEEYMEFKEKGIDPDKIKPEVVSIQDASIDFIQQKFQGQMTEMIERLPLAEVLIPAKACESEDILERINDLQKRQKMQSKVNLPVIPVAKKLNYAYDYGDGWKVDVILEDCYYTKDAAVFNLENIEHNDLLEKVAKVNETRKPLCLSLDGFSVFDDIGGIPGFIQYLEELNKAGDKEKEEILGFGKAMGWSNKLPNCKTLI